MGGNQNPYQLYEVSRGLSPGLDSVPCIYLRNFPMHKLNNFL